MMTKVQAINAIEAAGINNDSTAMVRIYTENRIGYAKAIEAWTRGCRMRHAKKLA